MTTITASICFLPNWPSFSRVILDRDGKKAQSADANQRKFSTFFDELPDSQGKGDLFIMLAVLHPELHMSKKMTDFLAFYNFSIRRLICQF